MLNESNPNNLNTNVRHYKSGVTELYAIIDGYPVSVTFDRFETKNDKKVSRCYNKAGIYY